MKNMIYRRLLELRSARVDRLIEEAKTEEQLQKDREREALNKQRQETRNRILQQ